VFYNVSAVDAMKSRDFQQARLSLELSDAASTRATLFLTFDAFGDGAFGCKSLRERSIFVTLGKRLRLLVVSSELEAAF
jgi:hypothetical protein